jgi:glycosyltransferase involved in cell wall biosynthesis
MSTSPLVSVIMATRDRPALAERALVSIASQRLQDFEVIIVDDGSSEAALGDYRRLCNQFGPRVRIDISVPSGSLGSGPAAVRNRGIRAARGQYIAFLDDDDEWIADDHLEVAIRGLRQTGAQFFFADMQGVREQKLLLPTWYAHPPELRGKPIVGDTGKLFRVDRAGMAHVFRHHMIHPDCWVIERQTLSELKGFNERLRFVEDLELGFRIVDRTKDALYRAEPVVRYRLPEGDAESLKYDALTILHQYVLAAQTVRASCHDPQVRRCARAREGWTLREIALELATRKQYPAALSFAWQSMTVFPAVGSAYALGSLLIESATGWAMPRTDGRLPSDHNA